MKLLPKKYVQSDAKNMLWDLERLPSKGPGPPELWAMVSGGTTLLRMSVWKPFASEKRKEARESGDGDWINPEVWGTQLWTGHT